MSLPNANKETRSSTVGQNRESRNFSSERVAQSAATSAADSFASRGFGLVAPVLHRASRVPHLLLRGGWAWASFRPGSRPRRMARSLALKAVGFIVARPLLVGSVRRMIEPFPRLRNYQRKFLAGLFASSDGSRSAQTGLFSERDRFVYIKLKTALGTRAT